VNHGHNDPEVCIVWKMNTKVDLTPFEKPIKEVLGEPMKTKEKK